MEEEEGLPFAAVAAQVGEVEGLPFGQVVHVAGIEDAVASEDFFCQTIN